MKCVVEYYMNNSSLFYCYYNQRCIEYAMESPVLNLYGVSSCQLLIGLTYDDFAC